MSYLRPAIAAMEDYTPGEQPKPGTPIIKLNTNENPYQPSPKAIAIVVGAAAIRDRDYKNACSSKVKRSRELTNT